MKSVDSRLFELGWKPFFQQQLTLDEIKFYQIARVIEQHRTHVVALSAEASVKLKLQLGNDDVCVGDWVLFDDLFRVNRSLERLSLFQRKAAGTKIASQLIAANIDITFIVCSLNEDFNLNRIERYISISKEAKVEPVIVLTKSDLYQDHEKIKYEVQKLDSLLMVHAINAHDKNDIEELIDYCRLGKTIALLGSSGVGKSTIANGLLGSNIMKTSEIREQDSKGRHTTTYRSIALLPSGGMLMDTPGMREIQLSNCKQGVSDTFSEISALSKICRFNDCEHNNEPGCAVQQAIIEGSVSVRRLKNYQKLLREQEFNSITLSEKRAKERAFSKKIARIQGESRSYKNGGNK